MKKPSYNHTRGDSKLTPCSKCKPKKKPARVMVVKIPVPPVPTDPVGKIAALESMLLTQGWQIIEQVFAENIAFLDRAILDKQDPTTREDLTDEQVDDLRKTRKLNMEVKDTPHRIISSLRVNDDADERDDPYETADDVRQARERR